jgi:hypothetical protein
MWKMACEDEVEAPSTSSTSGVYTGHFDYFHTAAYGAPNFGEAIFLMHLVP